MRKQFAPFVGQPLVRPSHRRARQGGRGQGDEVRVRLGGQVRERSAVQAAAAGRGVEDGSRLGAVLSDHAGAAAGHRREIPGRAALRLQERRRQSGDGDAGDGSEEHAGRAGRSGAAVADAAGRRDRLRRAGRPAATRLYCSIDKEAKDGGEAVRTSRAVTPSNTSAIIDVFRFAATRSGARICPALRCASRRNEIHHFTNSCTAAFSSSNSCSVAWNFCLPKASSFTPSTTREVALAVAAAGVAEDQPRRHAVFALRDDGRADPVAGRRRRQQALDVVDARRWPPTSPSWSRAP